MNAVKYNNESIYNTIERIVRTKSDIFLISLNENIQKKCLQHAIKLNEKRFRNKKQYY